MNMYRFCLRFHWSLFIRIQLTISQHWFRQWLAADQAASHYEKQRWFIYWCIFALLDPNKLTMQILVQFYWTYSYIVFYCAVLLFHIMPHGVLCLFHLRLKYQTHYHYLLNSSELIPSYLHINEHYTLSSPLHVPDHALQSCNHTS